MRRRIQGKTPDPLKLRIVKMGSSISAVARELNIPRNSVSIAVHKPKRLPGVRARIEEALR